MPSEGITLPPTELYEIIGARLANRINSSNSLRVRITDEPIIWLKRVKPRNCSLIVGSKSVTDTTNKVKYLFQWPFTYGELATEYLELCAGGKELPKTGGLPAPKAPVAFRGPTRGTFAYVDIEACYFSFYRHCTMDFHYGKMGFNQGKIPFQFTDELFLSKTLRNTIFGITRKRSRIRYKDGKFKSTNERSKYYLPSIARYVLSSVQAVAQEAWQTFPVQQWLTDAAIIPMSYAQELIEWLNKEWSLNAKIKEYGNAYSFAAGAYSIGQKTTSNLLSLPIGSNKLDTFEAVPIRLLKDIRQEITRIE